MTTTTKGRILRIGHSPDPDDAFMFYGFASGEVAVAGCRIEHVLLDIQTLNTIAAGEDPLEVTAMSAHAYFERDARYELLPVGTSVGRRYGPRVVARRPMKLDELAGAKVAMPGPQTTATLVARALLPEFFEVHMTFTDIMDTVRKGAVDAGVIIHEGQLTYRKLGLHLVADLGEEFAARHGGLPLPLGVNCILRSLEPALRDEIATAYARSVRYAMSHLTDAIEYAMQFARGLPFADTSEFVQMYVNQDSLQLAPDVRSALDILRGFHRKSLAVPTTREKVKYVDQA